MATGICKFFNKIAKAQKNSGFTLLELLVVLVIVGVLVSISTISIRAVTDTDELELWINNFSQKLEHAKQISALSRAHYGLKFTADKVQFMHYKEDKWQKSENSLLANIDYPEKSFFNLYLDSGKVVDNEKKVSVIIYASARITPFEFHLTRDEISYYLLVNEQGEIIAKQK